MPSVRVTMLNTISVNITYVHLVFHIDSLVLRLKLTKFKITVRTD